MGEKLPFHVHVIGAEGAYKAGQPYAGLAVVVGLGLPGEQWPRTRYLTPPLSADAQGYVLGDIPLTRSDEIGQYTLYVHVSPDTRYEEHAVAATLVQIPLLISRPSPTPATPAATVTPQ